MAGPDHHPHSSGAAGNGPCGGPGLSRTVDAPPDTGRPQSRTSTARRPLGLEIVAAGLTIGFLAFTLYWVIDGGARVDALTLRLDDWFVRGLVDAIVGNVWMLGEPQVALVVVAALSVYLVSRRRNREAALVAGALLVLSAAQLAVFVVTAEIHHVVLGVDALSHLYPSGHTARVPLIGTVVAMSAGRRARPWIFAATAILAVAVALDRTSSGVQTGSVVVGGLLLGCAVAAWFAVVRSTPGIGSTRGTD